MPCQRIFIWPCYYLILIIKGNLNSQIYSPSSRRQEVAMPVIAISLLFNFKMYHNQSMRNHIKITRGRKKYSDSIRARENRKLTLVMALNKCTKVVWVENDFVRFFVCRVLWIRAIYVRIVLRLRCPSNY